MCTIENKIGQLDLLYGNRKPFHGELHDHAATGGTSDGKRCLTHWKGAMEALHMDFGTILDHKQVRHMYLPEWEDGRFVGGTEPGTSITDSKAEQPQLHYNMIFSDPRPLEDLLVAFPEYQFTGGPEGHFVYPSFTSDRFRELIAAVKARGGFFVLPHPKQIMFSEDPLDYWFADETGIEVFYMDMRHRYTEENYVLWTDLLALGKRVWACAGGDRHACASDTALTTVYAEEHASASYLSHLRRGDFTCGSVGIQMCIGDTVMGGQCDFTGKDLILRVGDFHRSVADCDHKYCVKLLHESGEVFCGEVPCDKSSVFTVPTESRKFYRAEVFDVTKDLRIAVGNPIWNLKQE